MVSVSKISFKDNYKPNNLMADKINNLKSVTPVLPYSLTASNLPLNETNALKQEAEVSFKKQDKLAHTLNTLAVLSAAGIGVYVALTQKKAKNALSDLANSFDVLKKETTILKDSLELVKIASENQKLTKETQNILVSENGAVKLIAGSFFGTILSALGFRTLENGKNINDSVIRTGYKNDIPRDISERYLKYGAMYKGNGKTDFCYLAPNVKKMKIEIASADDDYRDITSIELKKNGDEFFKNDVDLKPKDRYRLVIEDLSGKKISTYDPYANYIPNDISPYETKPFSNINKNATMPKLSPNWSEVVDHSAFVWSDGEWMKNRNVNGNEKWSLPSDMVAEEVHIGLLGGYQGAKKCIDKIANEGIANTVKLMPIGEFYGKSNWGYDESCKYAPESSYGSPDDFKSLVDYAHNKNIRVILDVVPNHFGPLGSNIEKFMPVFSQSNEYTPWGKKLEFNQNTYALDYMTNMMMNWALNYHVDGFRLDSTQNIGSDTAIWHFMNEIRNCKETKDLIVYPEDSRISRAMANKNLSDKTIGAYNWGYNGQTTYDFSKELMSLVTNREIYGTHPSILGLEDIFKNGVHRYHEDIVKHESMADEGYRKYCDEISKYPNSSVDNLLIGVSNHDEIGNTAGGRRGISNILYFSLDLDSRFFDYDNNPKWKQENDFIYNLIDSYMKTGKIPDNKKQSDMGCAIPISQNEFEEKFKRAIEYNKIMIASMFLHPSPKEYFMGDATGEVSPFRYFCDTPQERADIIKKISDEKGYSPNSETFNMSKPSFIRENQTAKEKELSRYMTDFSRDIMKYIKANPALSNASFNTIDTYAHSDKNILEVKYRGVNGKDVVAIFNFSEQLYDNFGLNTMHDVKIKKDIVSDDKKYGGNINSDNQVFNSGSISIPPSSVSIYSTI